MSYILLIGSIQALFLGFLILRGKGTFVPNNILMVWMFVLGLNLFGSFLASIDFYDNHPQWYGYDATLILLHGPLAYLYVVYYMERGRHIQLKDTIHVVPYVFFTLYFLYKIKSTDGSYDAIKALIIHPDPILMIMLICIQASFIVYGVLLFIKLRHRKKQIQESYSFEEGVDLQWIKNMLWILIVIISIVVVGTIFSDVLSFVSAEIKTYFFYACLSFIPFYILYQAVNYNIFQVGLVHAESESESKYAGSTLTKHDTQAILSKLDAIMISEKPYLDSYFSISKLSKMLDVHAKYVSQVINEHKDTSFFNYINQFRVQEVMDKMNNEDFKHYTILGLALDAGFNTKSAFNKAFKKITGLTPSEYKKQSLK